MHLERPCAKPRALIVDDDPVVLMLLRHGLESEGVEVIAARDGASGLRRLVDHLLDLDLLITDLNMPGLDGPTLVRIIRAEGGERELPILVVATSISAQNRYLLERLGVNGIVEKSAGSDLVVRRAVELASEARDRRLAIQGDPSSGIATLVPIRLQQVRPA